MHWFISTNMLEICLQTEEIVGSWKLEEMSIMGRQQKNALKSLANAANSGIWKSEDVPSSWVDWKCCANEANFGILKIWRCPSWDGKNARRASSSYLTFSQRWCYQNHLGTVCEGAWFDYWCSLWRKWNVMCNFSNVIV